MQQVFASNSYHLMHQTYKDTQSNHFQNIGDLECFGACLSEKMKVGDRDTQELLRWLLLRGLHLRLLKLLLLLRKYLLEFQKRDSLQNTYCMHMHSIRIMHAQEMEGDDEIYSHVWMDAWKT